MDATADEKTCWYCGKRPWYPRRSVWVDLKKEISHKYHHHGTSKWTEYKYLTQRVCVPRCSQCELHHFQVMCMCGLLILGAIALAVPASLAAVRAGFDPRWTAVAAIILVGAVSIAIWRFLGRLLCHWMGITWNKGDEQRYFPSIKALKAEGWQFGKPEGMIVPQPR